MRVLLDMNLSPHWVPVLANAGHEVEHWSSIGPATATDQQIVEYAIDNACVIITHDLDFGILLATGGLGAPSVFQHCLTD